MDAFSKFIKEQMTSRIAEFHALSDLNVDVSLIRKVKHVIKREKSWKIWLDFLKKTMKILFPFG